MRNVEAARRGLTFSEEHMKWMTHRELGANVYTVPEAYLVMYSGRKRRAAMSLWYVWEWIIGEFKTEEGGVG